MNDLIKRRKQDPTKRHHITLTFFHQGGIYIILNKATPSHIFSNFAKKTEGLSPRKTGPVPAE